MPRKLILTLALSGLLVLPASLAFACHLERVSLELSCTQYKFTATAVNLPHQHSIKYSFVINPKAGGAPQTISKIIPVSATSGFSTESVTEALTLVGDYGAQSISGSASLLSGSGDAENTVEITVSPVTLNCPPAPQS